MLLAVCHVGFFDHVDVIAGVCSRDRLNEYEDHHVYSLWSSHPLCPSLFSESFSLKVVDWTSVLWSLCKHVCASEAGQFAAGIRGQTGWNFADEHLEGSTDEPEG